jgi:hypothetical protein
MKFRAKPLPIPVFALLPIYLGDHRWAWLECVDLHLGSMMGIPYLSLKGKP